MRNFLLTFLILFIFSGSVCSQDFDKLRSLNYSLGFQQIKEEMNYGLVFSGLYHRFNYRNTWFAKEKSLMYDGELGVSTLVSRGMIGLNFYFKPLDLLYNAVEKDIRRFHLEAGPWVKMEYNYQLYPELQSGYSFYFTNYCIGLGISAKYETDAMYLRFRLKNSVLGLGGRQPADRDPYFFDLSLGTYFRDQHQNFSGGSFNFFNNTMAELLYVNPAHPRIGYAYSFEYYSYNRYPQVKALSHNITLYFYPRT